MDDQLESVHTLTNRFEADLIMEALERESIPALLRSFEETPYDGLFVMQRGWGQILVPAAQAEQARALIRPLIQDLEQRNLYEDPGDVDPLLWESLRQADPQTICGNAQVRYDAAAKAYLVPFLDTEYSCLIDEERIVPLGTTTHIKLDFQFYMVILHYLLEAQPGAIAGNWVSEQQIPGGSLFFQGIHAFPTKPLEDLFGQQPTLLTTVAETLGAMRVASGDLSYRFWVLPRIPLLLVLWEGDDEFPAAVHIRLDASILDQLRALDTILAMVNIVCRTLRRIGKNALEPTQS